MLEKILYEKFGYTAFRKGQRDIITDIMAGHHVVAMLPTGGGKSLCYQIPGYLLDGVVLVVSPLLSLMEDQVNQLKCIGEKRVVAFNSFRTSEERSEVLRNIDTYKFIFTSPEMLQASFFIQALQHVHIALFVVDEAHCISQWGYDFRPDYQKLHTIIQQLGTPRVLAVTATATQVVLQDIIKSLHISEVKLHMQSVDRPNIAIQVEHTTIEGKKEKLLSYVKELQGPGIIYCSSRSFTESLATLLRQEGIQGVSHYHGGMEQEERMLIQQQFIQDQLQVVVCTSAFGMGINKSNVRYIIHYHHPANIESYLQEIGRAGRDGNNSLAIALVAKGDYEIPLSFIGDELPNEERIAAFFSFLETGRRAEESAVTSGLLEQQWRFVKFHLQALHMIDENGLVRHIHPQAQQIMNNRVQERVQHRREKLMDMTKWLSTPCCRREALLHLFQETKEHNVEYCCDFCGLSLAVYKKTKEQEQQFIQKWQTELAYLLAIEN